jgi:hypothetical protein
MNEILFYFICLLCPRVQHTTPKRGMLRGRTKAPGTMADFFHQQSSTIQQEDNTSKREKRMKENALSLQLLYSQVTLNRTLIRNPKDSTPKSPTEYH